MATGTQTEVVMPQMGVSVSEGTVTKWLRQVGEPVSLDEPLLEISTDKVDTEVPSPGEGVVARILVQEGETVEVGTVLALIAPAGAEAVGPTEPTPAPAEPAPAEPAPAAEPAAAASPSGSEPQGSFAATPAPVPAAPTEDAGGNGRPFVSPVVARIAAEHGVDPSRVPGTGTGGRVTKKDILAFIASDEAMKASEAAVPPPPEAPATPPTPAPMAPTLPAAPPPSVAAPRSPASAAPAPPRPAEQLEVAGPGETLEPMTAMRRGIAEHMRRSLDTSAHVTTVFEVDLSQVVKLRQRLKPEFAEQGVNLTYLAFIARATVATLRDWPWLNGEIRGDRIVTKQLVNLGVAVALEGGKGLIVPVIKNAQDLNLLGMARHIADVAERARAKKLMPDDVQGGSFTITNPGGWGAIMGTPIISQPQVGILDVEALVKRPVVVTDELGNDSIAIRSMMNLCLSYDHRLVDGAYAAQFMKALRESLEGWDETAY